MFNLDKFMVPFDVAQGKLGWFDRLTINPRGFKGAKFTKEHLPVKLVYTEEYEIEHEARMREQQLHGWTRAKKEALIQKFKSSRSLRSSKVQKLPQGILNPLNPSNPKEPWRPYATLKS